MDEFNAANQQWKEFPFIPDKRFTKFLRFSSNTGINMQVNKNAFQQHFPEVTRLSIELLPQRPFP
jgi:hypothetical protein